MPPIVPDIASRPVPTPLLDPQRSVPAQNFAASQAGGLGRGMQVLAGNLQRLDAQQEEEQQRQQAVLDDARSKEATNTLSKFLQSRMRDPEAGYLQLAGKAAFDARDGVRDELEKERERLASTLDDGDQQALFASAADSMLQAEVRSIDRHAARELEQYNVGETKTALEVAVTAALAQRGEANVPSTESEPSAFQVELGVARRTAGELADLAGLPADSVQRAEMVQGAVTQVHVGVVDGFVQDGELGEAETYLERVGGDLEGGVRAGLKRSIETASVAERGFQLASDLIRQHGSSTSQLQEARKLYESGDASFEVMQAATGEIVRRANQQHALRAREGAAALTEVEQWSQQNRHQEPTPKQLDRLRKAGVEREYKLWRLKGGHFITTTAGYELLDTISNAEFLDHGDFATLRKQHRMDLSEKHMADLRSDWEQAWNAAGRAASGSGGSGSTGNPLSIARTVVGFLRDRSHLFNEFDPLDKETQGRVAAFEDAVQRRLSTSQGKDDQAARDAVVRAVWNEGGILDGEWMPFEMATRDERERMQQAFVPAGARESGFVGPLQNEDGVRRVVPGDFDRGGPLSELRDRDTGRPDFAEFLARDTDPASVSDGVVVVQPGNEGFARTVHRDPVTGEALTETRSRVPSYEEIAGRLFEQGVPPTPDQVAAVQADLIAQNERANQRAVERAPLELQLRRDTFLTNLKGEYDLMVARLVAEDAERVQAPRDQVARLIEANPGAKVSRGEERTAIRIGKRTHYINTPPEPRPIEELEVAAWARLKGRHRKALQGYGITTDGFLSSPRELDPVWRLFHDQPMNPYSEVKGPFGTIPDAAVPDVEFGEFIWAPGQPERPDGSGG